MSKQKLAQLVMQKMQQKKQRQERNRPHREVLQLLVKFQVEDYQKLQIQIQELTKQISLQQQVMNRLDENCQAFENTGKKVYPRIIIQPDFIATQHVLSSVKQFYRKASNTFLREDIIKKKKYQLNAKKVDQIIKAYAQLKDKENRIFKKQQIQHKTINQKRVRNLKQDLRLRAIRQQQQNIKRTIQQQKYNHRDLIAQYELKKTNLHKRIDWAERLVILIQDQKKIIQQAYNPVTYREYLKKIFNLRTINDAIQKSLIKATKKVEQVEQIAETKAQFLQKNDNLFIQGKCTDSPSKKKRFTLEYKEKQKKIKSQSSGLLLTLKKTLTTDTFFSQQNRISKSSSFSTKIGRTTAGSSISVFKQGSRRSTSAFSELRSSRNLSKMVKTLGQKI